MVKTSDSSKSELWTARVPNNLAAMAREKAIADGLTRDDGSANTTLVLHAALKSWLGLPDSLPNTVRQDVIRELQTQIEELSNRLSETVTKDELEAELEKLGRLAVPSIVEVVPMAKIGDSHVSPNVVEVTLPTLSQNATASTPTHSQTDTTEPPTTQKLCKRLGINYSNLNNRAKTHKRTTEEQMISEALEKTGQRWQVCDRKGKAMFWDQVG